MNREEIIDLLTLAASYDRRTVGQADVTAWCLAVGDVPFADAQLAVVKHYQDSDTWLMPVHVRRLVKKIREERINVRPLPSPSPDEAADPRAYKDRLAEIIHRVGDGKMPFKAIPAGGGAEPSEEYKAARSDDDNNRVLAQTVACPVEWCPALVGEPCRPAPTQPPLAGWHPNRLRLACGQHLLPETNAVPSIEELETGGS